MEIPAESPHPPQRGCIELQSSDLIRGGGGGEGGGEGGGTTCCHFSHCHRIY